MKTHFETVLENGNYIKLPSAYFRKIEKLIGSDKLQGNVAIVIWKEEVPVRILVALDGELVETDAGKRYSLLSPFQVMELIEKEIETASGNLFDVEVQGEDISFYDEQQQ